MAGIAACDPSQKAWQVGGSVNHVSGRPYRVSALTGAWQVNSRACLVPSRRPRATVVAIHTRQFCVPSRPRVTVGAIKTQGESGCWQAPEQQWAINT